jgi:hypothetical protein
MIKGRPNQNQTAIVLNVSHDECHLIGRAGLGLLAKRFIMAA